MESEKKKLSSQTKLLVSFKSKEEISIENLSLVDILDLKDPSKGSLGSWKIKSIREIIKIFGKKKEISATLGDVSDTRKIIKELRKFDELKLNYIKFGIFSESQNQIENLMKKIYEEKIKTKLVPVIFVDKIFIKNWIFENFEKIKSFGFKDLLLDTYSKNSGNLLEICTINFLENFIDQSYKFSIKVGLAGKLKSDQIPKLLLLGPKILGFRSAACSNNDRNASISNSKIRELHSHFNS
tara:strand:- start:303 stop:1022 length:720 start_codon:yes stop_codon:yes gene_type:complete